MLQTLIYDKALMQKRKKKKILIELFNNTFNLASQVNFESHCTIWSDHKMQTPPSKNKIRTELQVIWFKR